MGRRRAVKASAGGGVRNLACTAPVGSSAPVGARGLLDLGVVGRRDSRGYNLALLGRERAEVHDQTIASSKHLVLMPKISEQLARSLYGAPAASGAVAAFTPRQSNRRKTKGHPDAFSPFHWRSFCTHTVSVNSKKPDDAWNWHYSGVASGNGGDAGSLLRDRHEQKAERSR